MAIRIIQRKSGRRYRVQIRDANGRQKSKCFQRRVDAEKWEREELLKRDRPELAEEEESELTFADLVELYRKHHLTNKAGSTQQRYNDLLRLYIIPTFGEEQASDIRIADVDVWFRKLQLKTSLKAKTLNHCLTVFKGVFNWGVRRQFVQSNPATPIQALTLEEKEFAFWSADEIEQFLTATANDHYFPVYVIALNTGMRLNEITGLQWDMVDLKRRVIRVARTWCRAEQRLKNTTKSKKARSVPINQTLHRVLVERKLESEGPWVVTEPGGSRLDSLHFTQQVFQPRCRELEIRVIRFHDLRHTYSSHFVMNGGQLYQLQKILGHHSVTETERYAHLSPDYLQGAANVVEFGQQKEGGVVSLEAFQQAKKTG